MKAKSLLLLLVTTPFFLSCGQGSSNNSQSLLPVIADFDSDGIADEDDVDDDNDGLSDEDETSVYGTDPFSSDTDDDGMPDAFEVEFGLNPNQDDSQQDPDNDGLLNIDESHATTNPLIADSDYDQLLDSEEVTVYLTDPLKKDSDDDGILDFWEINHNLNPLDPADVLEDLDADGYSAFVEFYLDTDPNDSLSVPVQQPWYTFQGNAAHTGFVLQQTTDKEPELLWDLDIQPYIQDPFIPYLERQDVKYSDGKAFFFTGLYYGNADYGDGVGGNVSLVALDPKDGSELWRHHFTKTLAPKDIGIYGDRVFIITDPYSIISDAHRKDITAFNTASGEVTFQQTYSLENPAFTPAEDGLYIGSANQIHRLNLDGSLHTYRDFDFVTIGTEDVSVWRPILNNEYLFACRSIEGDQVLNRNDLSNHLAIEHTEWLDNSESSVLGAANNLIGLTKPHPWSSSSEGRMTSYDYLYDRINWSIDFNSGQPTVALGKIFALHQGRLTVLDELTGGELWSFQAPDEDVLGGNIIVTLNKAIVSGQSATYLIDLEDQSYASIDTAGQLSIGDDILFISGSMHLKAFDISAEGSTESGVTH